jgi:O-antigen ligase
MPNNPIMRFDSATLRLTGLILCGVPILDTAFAAQGKSLRLAEAAIVGVGALVVPYVLRIDKWIMTWVVFLIVLCSLFMVGEFESDSGFASRQALSLLACGIYVLEIYFISKALGLSFLLKCIIILAILNGLLTLVVGFFPGHFGFLVSNISETGRSIGEIKLPFVRNVGLFNHYGYSAAYMLLAAGSNLLLSRGRFKAKTMLVFFIIISSAIVTQSRATWVSVLLFTVLCFFYLPEFRGKMNPRYLMARKTVLCAILLLSVPVFYRVFMILVEIKRTTFFARIDQFALGLNLFYENAFFGSGYGKYYEFATGSPIHNMFVTVLYSTGAVGFSVFIVMLLMPLALLRRGCMRAWGVTVLLPISLVLSASSGLSYYSFWLAIGCLLAGTGGKPVAGSMVCGSTSDIKIGGDRRDILTSASAKPERVKCREGFCPRKKR